MHEKRPLHIREILAASDNEADFSMRWPGRLPFTIRTLKLKPVSIRRLIALCEMHPTLVRLIDFEGISSEDDIYRVVGRDALIAFCGEGLGVKPRFFRWTRQTFLMHAVMSLMQITLPLRNIDDFFHDKRDLAEPPPADDLKEILSDLGEIVEQPSSASDDNAEPSDDLWEDSPLVSLVRKASDYTIRTGRDGFSLSPYALEFALRSVAENDRLTRTFMKLSIAAALGSETADELASKVI